jgi:thiol-disulfide isomerase/thioredoxin
VSRPVEVTLLTQDDCAFCDAAKQVLARVASEYPLHVREVDLATAEGQRLATSAGVLFAPGVLLDGEGFSYGRLSERKLRRALAPRASTPDEHIRAK